MPKRERDMQVTTSQICNGLSVEQRAVVVAPLSGVTCSPSGAGAGKTRTISRRAQHAVLVEGQRPEDMWVLSFTLKACDAMRTVLQRVPGPGPTTAAGGHMGGVRVCTLHSAAAAVLTAADPPVVASRDTCIREATNALRSGRVPGDALTVRHIMVDEAQDNDLEQFELLDALLEFMTQHRGAGSGLTIVGDSRQAIYAFRGGSVDAFVAAGDRYTSQGYAYRQLPLPQNFRSTRQITEACNALFRHTDLLPMRSLDVNGPRPTLRAFASPGDELCAAVRAVQEYLAGGMQPSAIMMLCRTNQGCAELVLALATVGVPVTKTSYSRPAEPHCVAVSTVHGEKGGEADIVFGLGLSDQQYPCAESVDPLGPDVAAAVAGAEATARACINVIISRARKQFHGSWSVTARGMANDRPHTVSRILADTLDAHTWDLDDDARTALGHPRAAFWKRELQECISVGALGSSEGRAERLLFGGDALPQVTVVAIDPLGAGSAAPEQREHAELLAADALGHRTHRGVVRMVRYPRRLLAAATMATARAALTGALDRLQQAPGDAAALLTLGKVAPWTRDDYSDVAPIRMLSDDGADAERAEALQAQLRAEAAVVRTIVGSYAEPLEGRLQGGRTKALLGDTFRAPVRPPKALKAAQRMVTSNRAWAVHETAKSRTLVTVCSNGEDATTLLVSGALVLAATFCSSSASVQSTDDIDIDVAVWDVAACKLHRMRATLEAAVHALRHSMHRVGATAELSQLVAW